MNFFDVEKELLKRNIPDLFSFASGGAVNEKNADKRRAELLTMLQKEEYGFIPEACGKTDFEVIKLDDTRRCAGKAIYKEVKIGFDVASGHFSFVFRLMLPKSEKKVPFVVALNFREGIFDEYLPTEEIIDRGVGIGTFCYKTDITSDDANFSDKLAGIIYPDGERHGKEECGKISMWAFCASRALDYILQNESESVDEKQIAVAGHSRLGKTALFAAACDGRFACAYSNNSGCSGAALSRGKIGESIKVITEAFPHWFCPGYSEYAEREDEMPFDQHFLLAAIAPRKVYVASAVEDTWADPLSEYLCCCAAGKFWRLYSEEDFPYANRIPEPGDKICGKNIGYHIRSGVHYWSRYDWNAFLDFFLKS